MEFREKVAAPRCQIDAKRPKKGSPGTFGMVAAFVAGQGIFGTSCAAGRHLVRLDGVHLEHAASDDPFSVVAQPAAIPALRADCTLYSPTGTQVSPVENQGVDERGSCFRDYQVPRGNYRIVVRSRCQPDSPQPWSVDSSNVVTLEVELPPRQVRYARPGQTVHAAVAEYLRSGSRNMPVRIPANSRVEVLRTMPNERGECSVALFRVVDAGRWDPRAEISPRPSDQPLFFVGDLEQLTEQPTPGTSPDHDLAERERAVRQREEVETRAAETLADSEIANNRCTAEHATALQRASQHVQTVFAALGQGSNPDFWTLESQEVFVAAPQQRPQQVFRFNPRSTAGEFHVFALAFLDLDFIVVDPATSATLGTRSGYEDAFRSLGGSIRGQMFRVAPRQQLAIGTRGRGCSLLMVFRHG